MGYYRNSLVLFYTEKDFKEREIREKKEEKGKGGATFDVG